MRLLLSWRSVFLALLLSLIPASSFAGVFVSVNFAPPVLPVYEQPPCPDEGLMWTPGYWAYGPEGYYWVPGAWVPAPYEGALWTPPYWGWSGGLYLFHPGYWGRHVGYYGGVNYGFGYMGVGFVGGEWHGHDFRYNRAVMRVDERRIHNTYVNETIVHERTIVNNNHIAYSGGPGGIRHDPAPEERSAMREQHMAPTRFQQQHFQAAQSDRNSYVKNNGGRPQNLAVARPMTPETHGNPGGMRPNQNTNPGFQNHTNQPTGQLNQNHERVQPNRTVQNSQPQQYHAAPQNQPRPEMQARPQSRPENHARPEMQERPQSRPENQSRPQHDAKPEPKEHHEH